MKKMLLSTICYMLCMLLALSGVLADTVIIRDGELVLKKLDVDTLQTKDLTAKDIIYTDIANHRVGIGIANPTVALDVSGQINATADICTEQGGGYCLAAIGSKPDVWNLVNGNATFLNGNVGIGDNTPNNPLSIFSATENHAIYITTTSGEAEIVLSDQSNHQTWEMGVSGVGLHFDNFADGGYALVMKKGTGNVGIGLADPQAKLDVDGGLRLRGVSGCSGKLYTDADGDVLCNPSAGVSTCADCDATFVNENQGSSINENMIVQNTIDDTEIQDNSLTAGSLAPNSCDDSELVDDPTFTSIRLGATTRTSWPVIPCDWTGWLSSHGGDEYCFTDPWCTCTNMAYSFELHCDGSIVDQARRYQVCLTCSCSGGGP